jgi:microcin C transport system permease protein
MPLLLEFRKNGGTLTPLNQKVWSSVPAEVQNLTLHLVAKAFAGEAAEDDAVWKDRKASIKCVLTPIAWPYPPVKGHIMGIDSAGRDVFARVLYATRISMIFGITLSLWAMFLGVIVGAMQGYFGGKVDICGQRLTEVWSAMPFLYIMILVGSVFGRGFVILLLCYSLFNWIGMSYYMRAEFLRLRSYTFVEAARCQGLSAARIIFGHILPNAMTPIITLLPFTLIGAIGSLAALDFLGFGLPPLTPSWGQLIQQAQQFRWAWWLILYPALALVTVILLTVLIGEGLRDAFDPKQQSRME